MAEKTTAFTGPVVVGLNDKKGEIRLTDGKNVNEAKYLSIAAPDNITSNTTLTFPNSTGTNGQFLKTDGNGDLTWSTPDTGGIAAVVDDTAPELGGDLASNGHDIDFADDDKAKFGNSGDLEIFHDGTNSFIKDVGTGQLKISGFDAVKITNGDDTIPSAQFISSGEAQLYYAGNQKLAANTDGITVTGKVVSDGLEVDGNIKLNGNYPTGTWNVIMGNNAGKDLTASQVACTLIGNNAGFSLESSSNNNTAIGHAALANATNANENTALGSQTLDNVNTGANNTGLGRKAGTNITTGSHNIVIGADAEASSATVSNEITIGNGNMTSLRIPGLQSGASANDVLTFNGTDITLAAPAAADPITSSLDVNNPKTIKLNGDFPTGTQQVALGNGALDSNTGGSYNTAIGSSALTGSTTGSFNVAVGQNAADANNGDRNVAVGSNALGASGTNSDNIAIGLRAMFSNGNGSENVAIGSKAMDQGNGGTQNVAIGHKALENGGNQNQNIAIGWQALKDCSGGFQNTVIGDDAMNLSVNAWGCVAIGDGALQQVEGVVNIGIGQSVGSSLTSGASNVLIGRSAATSLSTGDNNIVIGTQAQNSSATVSNEITLGNSSISTLRCNQTSISALSDARDKKDVEDANIGLDFINDLRPVKFVWDTRDGARKDIKEVGFIAQDLDEVQQKHGVEDYLQLVLKNNPDKLEAAPGKLIPILVQAIKDLKKEIDELKKA